MAEGKPQVRLEPDVVTLVLDEVGRIRDEENTDVSTAQAANRMIREWKKTRDAEMPKRKGGAK